MCAQVCVWNCLIVVFYEPKMKQGKYLLSLRGAPKTKAIYDLNLLAKWKHMIALLAKNLILSVSISNAKSVESDHTFDKIFKGSPQLLPFPSYVPPVSEIAYFWFDFPPTCFMWTKRAINVIFPPWLLDSCPERLNKWQCVGLSPSVSLSQPTFREDQGGHLQ